MDTLKGKTLEQLIVLYGNACKLDDREAPTIKAYILEHYSLNLEYRKEAALNEIDDMDLPNEEKKRELKAVKVCACEIAEHLDPVHINSYAGIEKIVSEQISISKRINRPVPTI